MIGELFEVALVVDSLDRAIREELKELRPAAPSLSELTLDTQSGPVSMKLTITYTMAGPLQLEIIESVPGTMWERLGVHHYGWFSDDLPADSAMLTERGMPLVATRRSNGGRPWQFVYHDSPPFGTIELVDIRMKPFLTDWWTNGVASRSIYDQVFGAEAARLAQSWR